jgi:tetratricopeptide (TPR) repeat protein
VAGDEDASRDRRHQQDRPKVTLESCTLVDARISSPADRATVMSTLFERSDTEITAGNFTAANTALDCVEMLSTGSTDWRTSYELTRRRGVLDYRQEHIVDALALFNRALDMATSHGDSMAEARSWKNVGSALRRLGDFRQALQAFLTSLEIYRHNGSEAQGPVLNNIADVYRDLHDSDQATRYYDEALASYRQHGEKIEAAHTLESMSVLALDGGNAQRAENLLQEAMAVYMEAEAQPYQLRVYAGLGRAAIARGEPEKAKDWTDRGLALAAQLGIDAPASLELQAARAERLLGNPANAQARLSATLTRLPNEDIERPALLEELTNNNEASGDLAQALTTLREFHAADLNRGKAQYDRELGWLRTRFETAERDRTIAALAAENALHALTIRQRSIVLWLTAVSALAALLAVTMYFYRRQQRARLTEVAREARLAEEIDQYRRAAAELVIDRKLLQAALDSRSDAILVLDTNSTVVAANHNACQLLGKSRLAVVGQPFSEHVDTTDASAFASAFERLEEFPATEQLNLRLPYSPNALTVHLATAEQEAGLVMLGLKIASANVADTESPPPLNVAPIAVEQDSREEFRRSLVELMLAVVEAWERSTGQGRLELAEKSRIWRITVDDGRLRVRAMDRYLSLAKLPSLPRWRDVLRSGYFVLAECKLSDQQRSELQQRVDAVLAYTRRRAFA